LENVRHMVAAAEGGGSASGNCRQRSINFWKGGGCYDVFGSVHYNVHSGQT
jgi:hypothetical protein